MANHELNIQTETKSIGDLIDKEDHKLYKRRWLILIIFMCFTYNGGIQWLEFSIIGNSLKKYFNVSSYAIEWTTECYMVAYVLLLVPTMKILNILGVRKALIYTSVGVCVGAWIKAYAVAPDRFYLLLIGQIIHAIFWVVTFGLAARITAVWFGANEISFAGSLALLGDQLGVASGLILPTILVKDGASIEDIGSGMRYMNTGIALNSTFILIIISLFLQTEPPKPPSTAQILQKEVDNESVLKSFRCVLLNPAFVLLLLSYGFNLGSFNAFVTLLNQVTEEYFEGHNEYAGNIGFIIMLSGITGSLLGGYILDKTRLFKITIVVTTCCSFLCMVLFTFCITLQNISIIYAIAITQGIFQNSYYSTGMQMGIEVTYPISEENTAGILLLSAQMFGFIITSLYGYSVRNIGVLHANIGLCILLLISLVLSCLIPPNMMRQQAENSVPNEQNIKNDQKV